MTNQIWVELDLVDWIDWEDSTTWFQFDWLYYYDLQYCLFSDEENL